MSEYFCHFEGLISISKNQFFLFFIFYFFILFLCAAISFLGRGGIFVKFFGGAGYAKGKGLHVMYNQQKE
jgi:hypothetical protein